MREETYRIFVTDFINGISESFGGQTTFRYADLLHVSPKVKEDTPEEIITNIRRKLERGTYHGYDSF